MKTRVSWSVVGPLLVMIVWLAHGAVVAAAEPFMGSYVNIATLFPAKADEAERERSMAQQLDRFRDAGLRVVMPYVTNTNHVAFYPSRVLADKAYGDWDPLAVLVRLARQRGLQIYPVICVMASGDQGPRGPWTQRP